MNNQPQVKENNMLSINYYNSMANYLYQNANADKKKYENFKERFSEFAKVKSINEAKELAKRILPTALEHTKFTIGNATCVVINKHNMFRISLDSDSEFICYDFS